MNSRNVNMTSSDTARQIRQLCTLVGFAFVQAWQMIAYASPFFAPLDNPFTGGLNHPYSAYINVMIALCAPLAILTKDKLAHDKRGLGLISIAAVIGTMILWISAYVETFAFPLFLIGACIMGFCDAFLLLSWVTLWSTIANGGVLKSICFSYVIAFLLYHFFLVLPYGAQACLAIALLPLSAFCLKFGSNELRRKFPPELQNKPLNAFKKKSSLVLAIATLHLIFGFSQVFNQTTAGSNNLSSTVIAGVLIFFATVIIVTQSTPEDSVSLLYRSVFLGIIIFIVFALLPETVLPTMAFGFIRFAMFALDTLTILLSADYAFRTQKPAYRIFGMLFSISRLSSFMGFFCFVSGFLATARRSASRLSSSVLGYCSNLYSNCRIFSKRSSFDILNSKDKRHRTKGRYVAAGAFCEHV